MKIQKKYFFFFLGGEGRIGGGGLVGLRGGGQGGCERGMIVFEKIHKKKSGWGVFGYGGCSGCGGSGWM